MLGTFSALILKEFSFDIKMLSVSVVGKMQENTDFIKVSSAECSSIGLFDDFLFFEGTKLIRYVNDSQILVFPSF